MNSKTSSHIIKKCIKGDRIAQRKLYETHRTRWFMISMRYGKSKMQAEDIFQEGLIQIFSNLKKYNADRGNFSVWSSRVLVNAALKFLQKSSWIDTLSDIDLALNHVDDQPVILDQMSAKELTEMIQTLPIGYRLVFNLYAIEGYTHKEIARELGISEGTSKSQLFKARRQLRVLLESQLKISRP